MSNREKAEAIARDLNDATLAAIESPSPANLREVSKLINALHVLKETEQREQLEMEAP